MRNPANSSSSGVILIILMLLILAGGSVFLFLQLRSDRVTELLDTRDTLSALLLVTNEQKVLSAQVFLYNTRTHRGALLDVPPHTGRILETEGRIGSIERLYNPSRVQVFRETVGAVTSLMPDFFIRFERDDFSAILDLFDGVEIFIPHPVEQYESDRTVLLPGGNLVLDGKKALDYMLYLDDAEVYSDIAERSQQIFLGLFKAMAQNHQRLSNRNFLPYVFKYVHADVSNKAVQTFFKEFKNLNTDRLVLLKLRGTIRAVDNEELLFPHSNGHLIRETLRQTIDSLASEDILTDDDLNLSLEILNGTHQGGLAARTSQIFLSFGYEVEHIGNAGAIHERTIIIDRRGDRTAVQRLAALIRCENIITELADADAEAEVPARLADVTIIVGKDFDGRYCR